ncbi:MAG: hypothetical protein IPN17_08080 [Deltaproteobacteria bacterium]|nr:hypothetical protein [Deltaproteobacteria bacterium]
MFYYFSADGASSGNLLYDVYRRGARGPLPPTAARSTACTSTGPSAATPRDGCGGRTGAANFTPAGGSGRLAVLAPPRPHAP